MILISIQYMCTCCVLNSILHLPSRIFLLLVMWMAAGWKQSCNILSQFLGIAIRPSYLWLIPTIIRFASKAEKANIIQLNPLNGHLSFRTPPVKQTPRRCSKGVHLKRVQLYNSGFIVFGACSNS